MPQHQAQRLREVILHGKWIANTNFKEALSDVDWRMATTQVHNFTTIAALAQHIHYYIGGVLQVFKGGTLDIHDKFSFDFLSITSQDDWENRMQNFFTDTERLAQQIENFPAENLHDIFVDEKYGNYYRNIEGLIEHSYYHLGQIILIKKIL